VSGEVVSRTKNTLNTVWQFRVALRTHTFTHLSWAERVRRDFLQRTLRDEHTHTHWVQMP